MTGQQGEQQTALANRLLYKASVVASVLFLASVAIAISLMVGKQVVAEERDLMVSAAGLLAYIVIAIVDARHALMLWLVTAPFARFIHLDFDLGRGIPNISLNRVMTAVLLALLLAQLASRRRRLAHLTVKDALLLAFGGAIALSLGSVVTNQLQAVQAVFDLIITPIALYFLARNLITSRRDLGQFIVALMVIGTYLGLLATREQLTGDVWFYPQDRSVQYTASIRRVVGLLGNPGFIAISIDMILPWAWYLLLTARRHRILCGVCVLAMTSGVFFCMNRSGWAALVISLVVMAVFVQRFRRIFVLILLLASIGAGTYWAVIVGSTTVRERLTAEGPIEYRQAAWPIAVRMIRDHPVFGVGYENYRYLYRQYGVWDINLRAEPSPHNTYLWVLVTGGLVAFIPFMAFLLSLFFSSMGLYFRTKDRRGELPDADLAGVFLASMAAILAPALMMDILAGYYNNMLLFAIIGAFWGVMSGQRRGQVAESLAAS